MGYKEAVEQHETAPAAGAAPAERLPLLYQGIFTAITRIQSGKPIPDQRRIEQLLAEIEREAVKAGYDSQDVREHSHYAVVAFVDETIQRSNLPGSERWRALQAKLYNEAKAGEGVYERLKALRSRRDSAGLADLLEIYCRCFMLGFEGQYALGRQAELPGLAAELKEQIERLRGRPLQLSPDGLGQAASEAQIIAPPAPLDATWKIVAPCCLVLALIGWLVLWKVLDSYAASAIREMLTP